MIWKSPNKKNPIENEFVKIVLIADADPERKRELVDCIYKGGHYQRRGTFELIDQSKNRVVWWASDVAGITLPDPPEYIHRETTVVNPSIISMGKVRTPKTLDDVRKLLLHNMAKLQNGELDIEVVKGVTAMAQTVVGITKIELQYIREIKASNGSIKFVEPKEIQK